MFKRFVIYPFLLGLYVVVEPLSRNLGQVFLADLWRPLLIVSALAGGCMLITWAIYRRSGSRSGSDVHYAGFVSFLVIVYFFLFMPVNSLLSRISDADWVAAIGLVAWTAALILVGSRKLWRQIKKPETITGFVNLVFLLTLILPSYKLISVAWQSGGSPSAVPGTADNAQALPKAEFGAENIVPSVADDGSLPDIYMIFVDGYARADVLEEIYAYDNTEFLDALEQMGFYVARNSHSNYLQTTVSLGAALNMNYWQNWRPPDNPVDYQIYILLPVRYSRAFDLLNGLGYQTIVLDSGVSFSHIQNAGEFRSYFFEMTPFEGLLLAGSPVDTLSRFVDLRIPFQNDRTHRQRVLYTLEQLRRIPTEKSGVGARRPKFVFAHLILPHPPFVFDRNGNPVASGEAYTLFDGSEFPGTLEEYRQGYREQVIFANHMLQETIQAILDASPTPPVILLQGDHGPGSMFDWWSVEKSCLWERTSILNALYIPNVDRSLLRPELSPVNSLRLVFDAYFGAHLGLLEDRTFFSSSHLPDQLPEITSQRESRANCRMMSSP